MHFAHLNNNTSDSVLQLLKCLTTKLVNYYSLQDAEFIYKREPDSQMIKTLKEIEVKNFITDNVKHYIRMSLVLVFNVSFQYFKK